MYGRDRWERRAAVATGSGVNVLVGLWLLTAPFMLDYGSGDPYWNDLGAGVVIVAAGIVRVMRPRGAVWPSFVNVCAGAWVFASVFWLDTSQRAAWNDGIAGIAVTALALASASAALSRDGARARR
jgi:hypothetical protein